MIRIKIKKIINLNNYISNLINKWELHYLSNSNKIYYDNGINRIKKIKKLLYGVNNIPSPEQILQLISNISPFPIEEFYKKSGRNYNGILHYKQIAAWYLYDKEICNEYVIAKLLNIHRTTVFHSYKTINAQANYYPKFKSIINDLNKELIKHNFNVK
jgi:hypothetical protein